MTLLLVAIRALVTLAALWLLLYFTGKRGWRTMRPLDLISALILGNLAHHLVTGRMMLVEGVLTFGTLIWLHLRVVTLAQHAAPLRHLCWGRPVVLIRDGTVDQRLLRREGVTPDQLLALVRRSGLERFNEIRELCLESDRSLTILRQESAQPVTVQALTAQQEIQAWDQAA